MLRRRRPAGPSGPARPVTETVDPTRASSPPDGPTRLALAGAGTISVVHALAAAAAGLPVVAVASRSPGRAAERASQVGAVVCTYDQLPAGADAVVVATPPALHAAQTISALGAGVAVLVEKPLATTLADADAMVAAGGVVVYAENLAFAPVVAEAVARAGRIGSLRFVEVRALSPRPAWGDFLQPGWGGGCLFDLGVHPVAVALLLAGDDEPIQVEATLSSADDVVVDDHAEVLLRFESGLEARLEASWRHPDVVWDLQASSATGVVRADLLPDVGLEHDGEQCPVAGEATPEAGADAHVSDLGYAGQMRALDRARAGEPCAIDAAFGRRVLDVVAAAYTSARTGRPEVLPFAGRRDRTPQELWQG